MREGRQVGTATTIPTFAPVDRPEVTGSNDVIIPELDGVLVAVEPLPGDFRAVEIGPLLDVDVNVKSDSRWRS
jgi:hypothetical protein